MPAVIETLEQLLRHDIEVKINAVVMDRRNIEDIIPLVQLTKELPVSVRFIEEMPFNGEGNHYDHLHWHYMRIHPENRRSFSRYSKLPDPPHSTAYNYHIPGHKGNIGIIAAYSRTFCGTCNRIRLTPQGMLKTCLYDEGVLNVKDLMRNGLANDAIAAQLITAIQHRAINGFEAERLRKKKNLRTKAWLPSADDFYGSGFYTCM